MVEASMLVKTHLSLQVLEAARAKNILIKTYFLEKAFFDPLRSARERSHLFILF
jgi:hypothetical protein